MISVYVLFPLSVLRIVVCGFVNCFRVISVR